MRCFRRRRNGSILKKKQSQSSCLRCECCQSICSYGRSGRRLLLQQPLHDYGHAAAASTTAAVLLEELKMELFFMRAGFVAFSKLVSCERACR
jgi:hypothetical protein